MCKTNNLGQTCTYNVLALIECISQTALSSTLYGYLVHVNKSPGSLDSNLYMYRCKVVCNASHAELKLMCSHTIANAFTCNCKHVQMQMRLHAGILVTSLYTCQNMFAIAWEVGMCLLLCKNMPSLYVASGGVAY